MITNIIDGLMYQLYSASLSVLDVIVICMVVYAGSWWLLSIVPWSIYSAFQKTKYERSEA